MEITLKLDTLTLGEMAKAEIASGLTLQEIIKSPTARLILALFIQELRTSEQPQSWQELSNRRLLDVSSSISQSVSTETPAK